MSANRRRIRPHRTNLDPVGTRRKIAVSLDVRRSGWEPRAQPFVACIRLGTFGPRVRYRGKNSIKLNVKQPDVCIAGKNPRQAIAKVLRHAAGTMARRTGAFAGLADVYTGASKFSGSYWKSGHGYVPCPRTPAQRKRASKAVRKVCR